MIRTLKQNWAIASGCIPPEKAIVLSVDEKSQIQALDRTQPGLPMKPGKNGTMTPGVGRSMTHGAGWTP